MRVGVAQFASKPDTPVNRAAVLDLLRNAAEGGAELVVLPEAAMYPLDRPPAELARVAEPLDGPFVNALVQAVTKSA